ncbi:MAG: low molecular weight phosphotyrosine protein phosphatase [Rugosibacter sp.]|nr:low molecular weight phosphotyrosine protein phosphatase [Rugosibacter sp.]
MSDQKVLFVCTGNICRSPTAEGVARALAVRQGVGHLFTFDSAGTIGMHKGAPPDYRAVQAAARRGYDLTPLRARQIVEKDFFRFDYVLAMDCGHLSVLEKICPATASGRLGLFLDYAKAEDLANPVLDEGVPDPYYGGPEGFDYVLTLVETTTQRLINHLLENTR